MSATPLNIQLVGNELAISWSDNFEHFYPLETLRRACPCAMCGGEPDVMGRTIRPKVHYSNGSFKIAKMNTVGGYALQIRWEDGHDTGLYSWKYLRALGLYIQEGHKPWGDDEEGEGHCDHHGEHDHQCEHGHNPQEPHQCCGGHHGHSHGTGGCQNK